MHVLAFSAKRLFRYVDVYDQDGEVVAMTFTNSEQYRKQVKKIKKVG
jgi:hypothetical protein